MQRTVLLRRRVGTPAVQRVNARSQNHRNHNPRNQVSGAHPFPYDGGDDDQTHGHETQHYPAGGAEGMPPEPRETGNDYGDTQSKNQQYSGIGQLFTTKTGDHTDVRPPAGFVSLRRGGAWAAGNRCAGSG